MEGQVGSPRRGGILVGTLALAAILSAHATALAQDPTTRGDTPAGPSDEAREEIPSGTTEEPHELATRSPDELHSDAKKAIEAEDLKRAERLLVAAASKDKSWNILANLGQVESALAAEASDPDAAEALWLRAADHLAASIRGAPATAPEGELDHLAKKLREARKHVVTLAIEVSPEGTCAFIEEREVGCSPFKDPVHARPGDVTITLRAAGHAERVERIAGAAAGSTATVHVALAALDVPAPPSPPPPGEEDAGAFPYLALGATAAGVGIAAVVVGGALFAAGGQKREEAAQVAAAGEAATGRVNFCRDPAPEVVGRCDEIHGLLKSHDSLRNTSTGLFIGGAVLAVGGGALLIAGLVGDDGGSEETVAVDVAPVFGTAGEGGILVRGRW